MLRWVVAVAVVGLVYILMVPTRSPAPVSPVALRAARGGGCGAITHPAADAPGGLHLERGQAYDYPQHPTSSGYHDPEPLPSTPHVYERPVAETRAVHNLEHAYVVIYYRGVSPQVVRALADLAEGQSRVIMAPYPDLPSGTGMALVAWNTLWECPTDVSASQAPTIARGFIEAYRGTNVAPEAPRGLLGPLLQP